MPPTPPTALADTMHPYDTTSSTAARMGSHQQYAQRQSRPVITGRPSRLAAQQSQQPGSRASTGQAIHSASGDHAEIQRQGASTSSQMRSRLNITIQPATHAGTLRSPHIPSSPNVITPTTVTRTTAPQTSLPASQPQSTAQNLTLPATAAPAQDQPVTTTKLSSAAAIARFKTLETMLKAQQKVLGAQAVIIEKQRDEIEDLKWQICGDATTGPREP